MIKKIILVVGLMVMLPVTYAQVFSYYDDFSSFNTSVWDDVESSGKYSVVNGTLQCNSSSGFYDALEFLLYENFSNEYTIEYDIIFNDEYSVFHNINNQPCITGGSCLNKSYISFSVYGSGIAHNPNGQVYFSELLDGESAYNSPLVNPYGTEGFFRWEKTNNENGTYHYKTYKNGSLIQDLDGVKNYSSLGSSIVPNTLYFFCGYNGNNDFVIDNFNLTVSLPSFEPENNAPSIIVGSPVNDTETNESMDIVFNVTDDNASTMSCSLYINDVLNATNSSVVNDTQTTFVVDWEQGIASFYINCSDGELVGNSGSYNFYLDNEVPNINSVTPNIFNTTTFNGYQMDIVGNVTNLNLVNVTRIIYYPNTTTFYYNETTSFVDTTFLGWSETYNTTLEPNGVYTMIIYAEDLVNTITKYYSFEVDNCVPSWACDGYDSCNISDEAECNSVVDENVCGLPYSGDYTEFSVQSCDYCAYDLVYINQSECDSATNNKSIWYYDDDFETCCNITGLPSDCAFGNESSGYIVESCSRFDYDEEDIADATIDTFVKFFIVFGGLVVVWVVGVGIIYALKSFKGRYK